MIQSRCVSAQMDVELIGVAPGEDLKVGAPTRYAAGPGIEAIGFKLPLDSAGKARDNSQAVFNGPALNLYTSIRDLRSWH